MIKKWKELDEKLDTKFERMLDKVYAKRKRNMFILTVCLFMSISVVIGGFKVYFNFITEASVCSSIVTDLVREKENTPDILWVQELYKNKSVSPFIKDVVEAVDNKDTKKMDEIGVRLHYLSETLAFVLAIGTSIVILLSSLLVALFGKIIDETLKAKIEKSKVAEEEKKNAEKTI